jgi:hypothetical protein
MGDREMDRTVSDSEAADFARQHKAEYILSSAKTGSNVGEIFTALINATIRWQKKTGLALRQHVAEAPLLKNSQKSQRTTCSLQ